MVLADDLKRFREASIILSKIHSELSSISNVHYKIDRKLRELYLTARASESKRHSIQRQLAMASYENTRAALAHNLSQISNHLAEIDKVRAELEEQKRSYFERIDRLHKIGEETISAAKTLLLKITAELKFTQRQQ